MGGRSSLPRFAQPDRRTIDTMLPRLFSGPSRAIAIASLCATAIACEPPAPARDAGDATTIDAVSADTASADTASTDASTGDSIETSDGAMSADSGVAMDAVSPPIDARDDTVDATTTDATSSDVTSDRAADASSDSACASPPSSEAPVGGVCRTNWLLCGGVCVDRLSDDNNCGSCGNRCAAGSFCYIGLCFCSCTPPLICCSDSCSRTRVCANTQTDPRHCGGCYRRCAAGQSCVDGMCR